MEFYSRSNYPKTIPMPECKKVIDTFSLEVDKTTGRKELKKTGKTNIYERIQKSLDETKIYNILERYQNGDIGVLEKRIGTYGDFTNLPKSMAEAQQILINAEKIFMALPLEERKEYNHNVGEFLTAMENEYKRIQAEKLQQQQQEIINQQQQQIEKIKGENE